MLSIQVVRDLSGAGAEPHLVTKYDRTIHVVSLDQPSNRFEFSHANPITEFAYLPVKRWLVFADSLKKLHIVQRLDEEPKSRILAVKELPKRPAKLLVNAAETTLVVGDKTGDVYSLDLADLENAEAKLIMGHMSMLTDMAFYREEKALITSDRDEKIRISSFPDSYNIESFLLAHKDFVTQIQMLDEVNLLSASGDASLIVWNLKSNGVRQHVDLNQLLASEPKDGNENKNAVHQFDFDAAKNRLLVHAFRSSCLLAFDFCPEEKKLSFSGLLDVQNDGFNYFLRLRGDYLLFVSLDADEATPVFAVRRHAEGKIVALNDSTEDDRVLSQLVQLLNEKISLSSEDRQKLSKEQLNDFMSFFKSKVDNMHEYYERKQDRMDKKTTIKRQRVSSLSSTTSNQQQQQQEAN